MKIAKWVGWPGSRRTAHPCALAASPRPCHILLTMPRKLSGLAFLAPDIQRAILAGHQPTGLTLADLMATALPLDWHKQREALGFA